MKTGNIVDYVKGTKNDSFKDVPFCTEDALVLSEFCYLKFEDLVGGIDASPVALEDIDKSPDKDLLFVVKAYEKDNRKLYNAMMESRRFKDLKVSYCINEVSAEEESQFGAVTFLLPENLNFVAFRGTDETMAGWQEDFSLALKKPILGQTLSSRYLDRVAEKLDKSFMVGGHSKGGNLAMYSAMCADKKTQDRIEKIYSFDGPGFRPEFLEDTDYDAIKDRLIRIMPKSSPVGLIFNAPGECEVIEAKSVSVLQHNPYNWLISTKDRKLIRTDMTDAHLMAAKSMNEFLLSMNDEELMSFVKILCRILDATGASTTEEFKADVGKHTKTLLEAGQNADEKVKEMINYFIKAYFETAGEVMKDDIVKKYDAFVEEINLRKAEVKESFEATKEKVSENIELTKEKMNEKLGKKGTP